MLSEASFAVGFKNDEPTLIYVGKDYAQAEKAAHDAVESGLYERIGVCKNPPIAIEAHFGPNGEKTSEVHYGPTGEVLKEVHFGPSGEVLTEKS